MLWCKPLLSWCGCSVFACGSRCLGGEEKLYDGESEEFLTPGMPLVRPELGVVLMPGKLLVTSRVTVAQSVFIKLTKPTLPTETCFLPCEPNVDWIRKRLPDSSSKFWDRNLMTHPDFVISETQQTDIAQCIVECLKQMSCSLLFYTPSSNRNHFERFGVGAVR